MRDWQHPAYKAWRIAVLKRDRFKCQWPRCITKGQKLHSHHIKGWADYPSLRFMVKNGITLCRKHHEFIHGHEERYSSIFIRILNAKQNNS